MKKNIFKNNKFLKILSWTGFGLIISGAITGATVGIVNFAKSSSQNKGTNFEDSVETVINISLDQNNTDSQNLEIVQQTSDRLIKRVQELGVSQIEIKSSIEYFPISINNSSSELDIAYIPYGSIHIFTEKNIPMFSIDFESDDYVSRIASEISLYDYLSNSYNYNLEAFNTNNGEIINEESLPNSSKLNKNFNERYQINSSDNVAYRNDTSINIPLTLINDNQDWNLDIMQQQFTDVYNWDGSTSRSDVVSNNNSDSTETTTFSLRDTSNDDSSSNDSNNSNEEETFIKTPPKLTYLFWENRTGFINKLQLLSTIAYLYNNSGSFHENDYDQYPDYKNDPYNFPVTTIDSFWEQYHNDPSSDESIFMEWVKNNNNYYEIMKTLYEANQVSYGIDNSNDPLLVLLYDFFSSPIYKEKGSIKFDNDSNSYEFLYSWNTEKISLFDTYLKTIDYNNFFTYFNDDTNSEDTEIIKTTYKSNEFIVSSNDSDINLINTKVDFINDTSFTNPVIISQLIPPVFEVSSSPSEIYKDFILFCNSFIYEYPSYLSNSIVKLLPYNGVLVGISVLILIIGIIVSILYRFPGVLAFLTSAFSFGLSFIMMLALNSLFSISTYVALIVSIICMFIPFINSQIHFRDSIRYNGNNFYNAFLNSIKSFIKTSIVTYVPLIICSLVFLFFGQNQINEFGSSLIVPIFANIISSCVIYLILYGLSYWLFMKNNPQLALRKPYLLILEKLKIRGVKLNINNTNTIIDKMINNLFRQNKTKFIIYLTIPTVVLLLGILGIILFAAIGPSYIGNSYNASELSIYFVSSDLKYINEIINAMTNTFNINWESKEIISNVYKDGLGENVSQYILISSKELNINGIYNWLKDINHDLIINPPKGENVPKNINFLINNMSFVVLNKTIPTLLFNNAIQCMFISIAFISIFSIIYINFMNFIPIMLITILTNLVSIGFVGLLRIPVDINTVIFFLGIFALSNIFIFNTYNNLLWKFNKKIEYSNKEIFNFGWNQIKSTLKLQLYILLSSFIYGLVLMLFVSTQLVYNQLILLICTFTTFIISVPLSFIFSILMLCIREWYITNVRRNKKSKENKKVYDKIDEQMIVGINAH